MNADRNDSIDHAIDEVLASMVQGEPRRVSGPSVRQAAGEGRLGPVFLKYRAPLAPAPSSAARSTEGPAPVEVRATSSPAFIPAARVALTSPASSNAGAPGGAPAGKGLRARTTTEAPYEGLPRLTVASIDLPEPLSPRPLDADPIRIPRIEIAPLAISGLSNEQEHK
jgi:hypothetical protein